MKQHFFIGLLSIALAAAGLSGQIAVTVDFNGLPDNSGGSGFSAFDAPHLEDGVQVTTDFHEAGDGGADNFYSVHEGADNIWAGSISITPIDQSHIVMLSTVSGDPFDLLSIDIDHLAGSSTQTTVAFTGFIDGGGTVTDSHTTNLTGGEMETFGFTNWSNLTSVSWEITDGTAHFDNIELEIVPELSGFSLYLGLAAFGLCVYFRKRKLV